MNGKPYYRCGKCNPSYKHGGSKTQLYKVWFDMKRRCYDKKNKAYRFYGGRGLGVCAAWREEFIAFRDWALGNGYIKGLEIDRINTTLGYFPENCRWVTHAENVRNTPRYKLKKPIRQRMLRENKRGVGYAVLGRKYGCSKSGAFFAIKRERAGCKF